MDDLGEWRQHAAHLGAHRLVEAGQIDREDRRLEVEVIGDDIGGIAVHIAARISALAEVGEILTSSTVRDLVAGSGLEFDDRGEQELKGVPGTWRVLAVR